MLFPIGQESDTVRRVPWVTIAIIALCVIIHIINAGAINEFEEELFSIYSEIYEYYISHPYLELDEELKQTFMITEEMDEVIRSMTTDKYSTPPTESEIEEMQEYLDNLVEELNYTKQSLPFFKYGLVPKKKTFVGLIGHMFIHAGWLHLLFNLLYLYLLGPFIEDSWGKPVYAVFYLGTGILAALAFAAHYPNSGVPMVGASGAIAGVMGGFLIRHWHARIRYFYMFSLLIRGTFTAPAWVMLPIGFIMELINASIMDSIAPEGGGGVAHWAHVWGFIFGVVGALVIKFTKIEEKFVAPKVEAETTYVNKGFVAYEEAMQLIADGDKPKAYNILIDAAKEDSSNQDVIEALWNLALEMGRISEVAPFLARLIEREVQQAHLESALFHFRQLRSQVPDARFSTHTKIKIFEQAVNIRDDNEAKDIFNELINEVNLASPPGLVSDLCDAALKFDLNFDQSLATKVVELALQHPEIPEDRKESLKQQLYTIPEQKADAPIKVESQYDQDFSQLDSKGDVGGVSSSSVSSASSMFVPLVPTTSTTPSASQEPTIPIKPREPDTPLITQEPTIPSSPQEPEIPVIPTQAQPPPIFEESHMPGNPQEPDIASLTREPETPLESITSQPPPIPPEPVIPIDPQEPPVPLMTQEPTIPPSPQEPEIPVIPTQAQPPPIFEESGMPGNPQEPDIASLTRETEIPMESIPSQPPPIPVEPVIPTAPQEPPVPLMTQEPTVPPSPIQSQPPPPPIEPIIPVKYMEPTIPVQPGEPGPPVPPEPPAEEMVTPPPPPEPQKRLRVTKAVPLSVRGGKIALKIEKMGQRVFDVEKIKTIAVVKISPPGDRPFLLIDLFVDNPGAPISPTDQEAVIRTLRLMSTNFNPLKFVVGVQSPLDAFKIFTSSLLRISKANPFPNTESVQLKKVAGYRSIKDYEDALLNASDT